MIDANYGTGHRDANAYLQLLQLQLRRVASGGVSSSIAQLAGPDSSTTTRPWHAHAVASDASAVAAAYVDANAHRRANARGRAASAIAASPAARLAS